MNMQENKNRRTSLFITAKDKDGVEHSLTTTQWGKMNKKDPRDIRNHLAAEMRMRKKYGEDFRTMEEIVGTEEFRNLREVLGDDYNNHMCGKNVPAIKLKLWDSLDDDNWKNFCFAGGHIGPQEDRPLQRYR